MPRRRTGLLSLSLLAGAVACSVQRPPAACARLMELRLIPDLVEDVRAGRKTSSVRADNPPELRIGPALFKVPDASTEVPITLTAVTSGRRLDDLSNAELRAQGPFVADILATHGRAAALDAVFEGMQPYYPGYARDHDVTVIHFRVR